MTPDVIIVGAGPVGLFLACELRLAGLRPLVFERELRRSGLSKAIGLPGRTADYLDYRGLLDRFAARANPAGPELLRFLHFGGVPLDLSKASVSPRGVFVLQAVTEELMEERAQELEIEIRRGHEVIGLLERDGDVVVEVKTAHGSDKIGAAFIVGCDGGRSTVRRLAHIDFEGLPPTSLLRLGDVLPVDEDVPFLFPLGDGYFRLVTKEPLPEGFDRESPMTLSELEESAARVFGRPVALQHARWLSRFTDASRQAARYWRGRVALAGDAAHIFLPAGGPGLLTGFGDAMNLGWKVAAFLQGRASASILESYHQERSAVGSRVLMHTRAQGLMTGADKRAVALRDVFAEVATEPSVIDRLVELLWQLDVRYPSGDADPLVGAFSPDLVITINRRRIRIAELMHEARWLWLELEARPDLRSEIVPFGRAVQIVTGPTQTDDHSLSALLIRPDGHVAFVARRGSQVKSPGAVLSDWLQP